MVRSQRPTLSFTKRRPGVRPAQGERSPGPGVRAIGLAFLLCFAFAFTALPSTSQAVGVPAGSANAAALATPQRTPLAVGKWGTPAERALSREESAHGIPFSYSDLQAAIGQHQVRLALLNEASSEAVVQLRDGSTDSAFYPPSDSTKVAAQLIAAGASVSVSDSAGSSLLSKLFFPLAFILFMILAVGGMVLLRNQRAGGSAGKAASSHTRARGPVSVIPDERFTDVAGCDEAVDELREMVDFMLHPEPYLELGAKLPSGVILYGIPGVGKTLLAKAVAGESAAPFYAAAGSDFVELYVGTGAARIRSLFAAARKTGGVIFIDEIDAVGKVRGAPGSHDEGDRTLNQLLVEMDGFTGNERIVVIAATNRLDTLDPALLRPGRFSRHIHVGAPSQEGRLAILRVYSRNKPLAESVDLKELAASSSGATGADLAEALNEGAIMAAREKSKTIRHEHLWEGFLRVVAGPRKASSMLAEGERETIAYHEAGHVLCAELCPTCDPTLHATINPRGQAAGFALIGQSDRSMRNEQDIHEQLIFILGGRAAEYVLHATVSSGAANDLQKANTLARHAVDELGLSPEVGQIISGPNGLSEVMRAKSDSEVRRLVEDAYRDAVTMVTEHREQLDRLAQTLLSAGDIDRPEIVACMRGSVPQPRRLRHQHRPLPETPLAPVVAPRRQRRMRMRLPELAGRALAAFAAERERERERRHTTSGT